MLPVFLIQENWENNWEELVTNVADVVQKKLKELIEIFNIYIYFFSDGYE